jgi:hypothetical protein
MKLRMDLHAAYQLAPEVDHITGKEISSKPKGRRRSGNAMGTDQDVRRGDLWRELICRMQVHPALSRRYETKVSSCVSLFVYARKGKGVMRDYGDR